MRALIVLLLLLASMASARETILSGDSDHTILPSGDVTADHTREVMLFRSSILAKTGYGSTDWYQTWSVNAGVYDECLPVRGHENNYVITGPYVQPGPCTDGKYNWTTSRDVIVTRVALILHAPPHFGASAVANCRWRMSSISSSGTITGITSDILWPEGVMLGLMTESAASHQLSAGDSIGMQVRYTAPICLFEDTGGDLGYVGEFQVWGVYK